MVPCTHSAQSALHSPLLNAAALLALLQPAPPRRLPTPEASASRRRPLPPLPRLRSLLCAAVGTPRLQQAPRPLPAPR